MTGRANSRNDMLSVTDIWRKIDGRWRAVHEHSWLPINMQTGAVIMKQRP